MKTVSVFTASWGQLNGRHSNMGDIIIFEAILDILHAMRNVRSIYCYSADTDYTDRRYGVRSSNPFTLSGLLKTIRNIYRADVILIGGGELVQTRSSFLYLVANLAPAFLGWVFRKQNLAIGAGIANMSEISASGKRISRFVFNRMDRICVRDRSSFKNAIALGIDKGKLSLTADLAFHFANVRSKPRSQTKAILFCPRFVKRRKGSFIPYWAIRKITKKGSESDFTSTAKVYGAFLKQLSETYRIIILPVYRGQSTSSEDFVFAERIRDAAGSPPNIEIYRDRITAKAILRLMQRIDLVLAIPLHALIMAAIARKPLIALPYASKCSHLMAELDMEAYILKTANRIEAFDTASTIGFIEDCLRDRERVALELSARLDKLTARHQKNIASIEGAIDTVHRLWWSKQRSRS